MSTFCDYNLKCDCKMLKVTVAVIILNVTAKCGKLQFFKFCNHMTATFKLRPQNSKSDSKIHKYDGKF